MKKLNTLCIALVTFLCSAMAQAIPFDANGQPYDSLAPMLDDAMPSVVNIATVRTNTEFLAQLQQAPGAPIDMDASRMTNLASGVVVGEEGFILTNFHVVQGAEEVVITLNDGRSFPAKFIGGDPESDVAVIHIDAKNLTPIKLGNSDQLRVGDFVLAIGNPFGLSQSVSSGIVSALGRSDLGIEGYEDFIQTDAPINMGNSGGALVNTQGELVGINTAILSASGGSVGIGFAIPINMAHNIMQQLIQYGEVQRGLLGVVAQSLTPDLAQAFKASTHQGAVISHIVAESPAQDAGLQVGDVVLSINDRTVHSASELRNQIGLIAIGEAIHINIERLGKARTIQLEMSDPRAYSTQVAQIHPTFSGIEIAPLDRVIPGHGEVTGVELLYVAYASPAWRAGLRSGDIITHANHQGTASVKDLQKNIDADDDGLLLRVLRGPAASFMMIR